MVFSPLDLRGMSSLVPQTMRDHGPRLRGHEHGHNPIFGQRPGPKTPAFRRLQLANAQKKANARWSGYRGMVTKHLPSFKAYLALVLEVILLITHDQVHLTLYPKGPSIPILLYSSDVLEHPQPSCWYLTRRSFGSLNPYKEPRRTLQGNPQRNP